ncbi:hypothetical protein Avbf_18020 [Armadillidium vulgare]|nr:hypothetical protein Avbf_18020 [Armadillidium vulgare]
MDIKSEVEIKEELVKGSEDYINEDLNFEQEVKNENFSSNIKDEFEVTEEFFDFNEKNAENGEQNKEICGLEESQQNENFCSNIKEEFEITEEFFDFNEKNAENGEHNKEICGLEESQV